MSDAKSYGTGACQAKSFRGEQFNWLRRATTTPRHHATAQHDQPLRCLSDGYALRPRSSWLLAGDARLAALSHTPAAEPITPFAPRCRRRRVSAAATWPSPLPRGLRRRHVAPPPLARRRLVRAAAATRLRCRRVAAARSPPPPHGLYPSVCCVSTICGLLPDSSAIIHLDPGGTARVELLGRPALRLASYMHACWSPSHRPVPSFWSIGAVMLRVSEATDVRTGHVRK